MLLKSVLNVIRVRTHTFGLAALLIGGCSVLPNERETLRIERVKEAVLPMARIALEAEQTETARRLYLRLLEVDPNSVSARMGLGEIAVARRDSAEAARWYAAAITHARKAEERHAARLAHGRAALAAGQLEAARESFSRLVSERENAPAETVAWGLNGLGLVALLEGDIRGATGFMEQAVLLAPEEQMLVDNLSRALDMSAGASAGPAGANDMAITLPEASPPDEQPSASGDDAMPVAAEKDDAENEPPVAPRRAADPPRGAGDRRQGRTRNDEPSEAPPAEPTDEPPDEQPSASEDDATPFAAEREDRESESPVARRQAADPPRGAGDRKQRRIRDDEPPGTPTDEPTNKRTGEPVGENSERQVDKRGLRPYAIVIGGRYFVRIGVYVVEADARALAAELRRVTTEPLDVFDFGMGDGSGAVKLYRVVVGPIRSRAGLVELVETLDAQGYGSAPVPSAKPMESEPVVAPESPPARQTAAGPELVEVLLSPVGVEAEPETPAGDSDAEVATRDAELSSSGDVTEDGGEEDRVAVSPSAEPEPPADEVNAEVASSDAELPPSDVTEEVGEEDRIAASPSVEPAPPAGDAGATMYAGLSPNSEGTDELEAPQYLQVGAYTVRSTSEALAAEVGGVVRAPVRIVEAELANGETMYRVQVGPVRSRRMMAELSAALMSGGYGTVRVLPESAAAPSTTADAGEATADEPPPVTDFSEHRVKAFIVHEDGRRFLQMGAYAVRATSDTLASQLRLITTEPVFVAEVPNDAGGFLYRVRIGPIKSDASLDALIEALRSSYGSGWVLPSTEPDDIRTAFVVREDDEAFLQVGAYTVQAAADALAAELRGQMREQINAATVRVTEVFGSDGKLVYRVRVGPVASDEALSALVEAVESLGFAVD